MTITLWHCNRNGFDGQQAESGTCPRSCLDFSPMFVTILLLGNDQESVMSALTVFNYDYVFNLAVRLSPEEQARLLRELPNGTPSKPVEKYGGFLPEPAAQTPATHKTNLCYTQRRKNINELRNKSNDRYTMIVVRRKTRR